MPDPLRVLIACERFGVVRDAFLARGHDAWSLDMVPCATGSNRHITGDVRDHLDDGWDLMAVMHPPCTVLCNSGVKHLYLGGRKENGPDPARWAALDKAAVAAAWSLGLTGHPYAAALRNMSRDAGLMYEERYIATKPVILEDFGGEK